MYGHILKLTWEVSKQSILKARENNVYVTELVGCSNIWTITMPLIKSYLAIFLEIVVGWQHL